MSAGQGTQNFLNTLRVAGRMWGSHGDKITNAAQGRNFDDERAVFKKGGGISNQVSGAGGEDSPRGGGSPIIMRQASRDLVVSPSSPFLQRQPSSPTSAGRGEDFVSSTAAAVVSSASSSPLLIGRQASREMPLPEILRQHSRELASTSPGNGMSNNNNNNNNNNNAGTGGFRPIADRDLATSPVSFLVPTLPPGSMTTNVVAAPTVVRPNGLRPSPINRMPSSPSSSPKNRNTTTNNKSPQELVPRLLALPDQGSQQSIINQKIAPTLPASVLEQASQDVSKRDHVVHQAEHAAVKAVHDVVGNGGMQKDESKGVPDANTALSATDKAELVLAAQPNRRKSSLFGRKKSWGRKSSAGSTENASVSHNKSSSSEEGGARGGNAWKPGHYLSRLVGNGTK